MADRIRFEEGTQWLAFDVLSSPAESKWLVFSFPHNTPELSGSTSVFCSPHPWCWSCSLCDNCWAIQVPLALFYVVIVLTKGIWEESWVLFAANGAAEPSGHSQAM
jgi:hypothetical protein